MVVQNLICFFALSLSHSHVSAVVLWDVWETTMLNNGYQDPDITFTQGIRSWTWTPWIGIPFLPDEMFCLSIVLHPFIWYLNLICKNTSIISPNRAQITVIKPELLQS
jgi:hypothetical protein